MPSKTGRLTPQESSFAMAYAATGDKDYARQQAGWSERSGAADKALRRPGVLDVIAQHEEAILTEALPIARRRHIEMLQSDKTPPGTVKDLIKIAYEEKRLIMEGRQSFHKDPSEMTAQELADLRQELELKRAAIDRAASDNAKPIVEAEPIDDRRESPETGAFD